MGVTLTKDSIDLGIVTRDAGPMVEFYRDVLGLEEEGELPVPGIGTMTRLKCGESLVKVVQADPAENAAPGGLTGATGYRYWTLSIEDLEDAVTRCEGAGRRIVVRPTEIRPGTRIAMVEDPDGNWVEFLEQQ